MANGYDRELVERLIPAVWDSSYAYGMDEPRPPDPDMPRARPNPKWGCTLFAHLADIQMGWRHAPLTRPACCSDPRNRLTQREIADHEGVTGRPSAHDSIRVSGGSSAERRRVRRRRTVAEGVGPDWARPSSRLPGFGRQTGERRPTPTSRGGAPFVFRRRLTTSGTG
jgi:hypothetical protein